MFTITCPESCQKERKYIYELMLNDFLGIEIKIKIHNQDNIVISNDNHKKLILADNFFAIKKEKWLTRESLPKTPCLFWNLKENLKLKKVLASSVPIIFGGDPANADFINIEKDEIHLELDIFGSAFFMLTRYEESVTSIKDKHGRFPADSSFAYQNNFLDQPVVNTYLEILFYLMKTLWQNLKRKKREYHLMISHDVDHPFAYVSAPIYPWLRNVASDLIKKHHYGNALSNSWNGLKAKSGLKHDDPFDTFDWLMDIDEKADVRGFYYFMTDNSLYSFKHSSIRQLIRRINKRGHQIGFHPGLNTAKNKEFFSEQAKDFFNLLDDEGINQNTFGGRQHYLMWNNSETWQIWNDSDFNYDATLGFPECAGFRTGICYEYQVFNLKSRERLHLKERPLLIMDCSLFSPQYMNLKYEQAWEYVCNIKSVVKHHKGNLELNWHNSWFNNDEQSKDFYTSFILED